MFRNLALCITGLLLVSPLSRVDGADVSMEREFYAQPTAERMRTFRQHALEEQLELFFYGNQKRHPPAIYLARCFALNGTQAVELLRARLFSRSDDLTIRDISVLLAAMQAMGTYDVSTDAKLMNALRLQVANMQNAGWRDSAQREIASIQSSLPESAESAPECGPAP